MHLDDQTLPGWLAARERPRLEPPLRVEPAGEGNINYVRRVRDARGRSVVVKHARAALERFPEYRVHPRRLIFEHRYGETVRRLAESVASVLPAEIDFDPELPAIVMEDVCDSLPLADALARGSADPAALETLGSFLGTVHSASASHVASLRGHFDNGEMRALHGEHIFTLPFEPNDFGVAPAIADEARGRIDRAGVRQRIRELRDLYYGSSEGLVHGDVQGTNVLLQGPRPRLLDAEISHLGDPAFDLGIALAHLDLEGIRRGGAPLPERGPASPEAAALLEGYRKAGGTHAWIARSRGYQAVELLRRTLGAARLRPLEEPGTAARAVGRALALLTS
ncbi:MAG: phosphotransferase [Myxococcota bacterium]